MQLLLVENIEITIQNEECEMNPTTIISPDQYLDEENSYDPDGDEFIVEYELTHINDEEVDVAGVESGFVPLGIDGQVTGRGLVRGGRVRHEIPKVQARWLAKILRH